MIYTEDILYHSDILQLLLALFIPDVRPEIIPMLPAHLGEKTDMEKLFTWCVSNLIFSATT